MLTNTPRIVGGGTGGVSGVSQIIAGSGISVNPPGGTGNVTVSATSSGEYDIIWDGADSFETFYNANNVSSFTFVHRVILTGTGHSWLNPSVGLYTNIDKLYFVGKEDNLVRQPIVIGGSWAGSEMDVLPAGFENIDLLCNTFILTGNVFKITGTTYSGMVLNNTAIRQTVGSPNMILVDGANVVRIDMFNRSLLNSNGTPLFSINGSVYINAFQWSTVSAVIAQGGGALYANYDDTCNIDLNQFLITTFVRTLLSDSDREYYDNSVSGIPAFTNKTAIDYLSNKIGINVTKVFEWDSNDLFSTFYTTNQINTLTSPVLVMLKKSIPDHTIDGGGTNYNSMKYLNFVGGDATNDRYTIKTTGVFTSQMGELPMSLTNINLENNVTIGNPVPWYIISLPILKMNNSSLSNIFGSNELFYFDIGATIYADNNCSFIANGNPIIATNGLVNVFANNNFFDGTNTVTGGGTYALNYDDTSYVQTTQPLVTTYAPARMSNAYNEEYNNAPALPILNNTTNDALDYLSGLVVPMSNAFLNPPVEWIGEFYSALPTEVAIEASTGSFSYLDRENGWCEFTTGINVSDAQKLWAAFGPGPYNWLLDLNTILENRVILNQHSKTRVETNLKGVNVLDYVSMYYEDFSNIDLTSLNWNNVNFNTFISVGKDITQAINTIGPTENAYLDPIWVNNGDKIIVDLNLTINSGLLNHQLILRNIAGNDISLAVSIPAAGNNIITIDTSGYNYTGPASIHILSLDVSDFALTLNSITKPYESWTIETSRDGYSTQTKSGGKVWMALQGYERHANAAVYTTYEPHGLSAGDKVKIANCTTDPTFDENWATVYAVGTPDSFVVLQIAPDVSFLTDTGAEILYDSTLKVAATQPFGSTQLDFYWNGVLQATLDQSFLICIPVDLLQHEFGITNLETSVAGKSYQVDYIKITQDRK